MFYFIAGLILCDSNVCEFGGNAIIIKTSQTFPVLRYECGKKPLTIIIVLGFRPKSENLDSGKKDTVGKGTPRGAKWHQFQLRSCFQ